MKMNVNMVKDINDLGKNYQTKCKTEENYHLHPLSPQTTSAIFGVSVHQVICSDLAIQVRAISPPLQSTGSKYSLV